jgi:DNA ligase-associated metallophosphoesterase
MHRMIEMRDGMWAHASGALWLAGDETLLIADAHLGYGWAMRRRGQLGPVRDREAVEKLREVVIEMNPRVVVFLGDLVHAPRPSSHEAILLSGVFEWLASRVEVILVEGNHDRSFRRDFGHLPVAVTREWTSGSIRAVHGDRLEPSQTALHTVLGHFHPAVSVRDPAGAKHRLPAFVFDGSYTVMPAFSPFAAGADLGKGLPAEMKCLFADGVARVVAVTGIRALPLKPLHIGSSRKQTASG